MICSEVKMVSGFYCVKSKTVVTSLYKNGGISGRDNERLHEEGKNLGEERVMYKVRSCEEQ